MNLSKSLGRSHSQAHSPKACLAGAAAVGLLALGVVGLPAPALAAGHYGENEGRDPEGLHTLVHNARAPNFTKCVALAQPSQTLVQFLFKTCRNQHYSPEPI